MTREQVDRLTEDYERLRAKRDFLERKLSQVRDECFTVQVAWGQARWEYAQQQEGFCCMNCLGLECQAVEGKGGPFSQCLGCNLKFKKTFPKPLTY